MLLEMRTVVTLLLVCGACRAEPLRFWVEACAQGSTACLPGDPDLASWAMEAWEKASAGKLTLVKTGDPDKAQIRFHWVGPREGMYGETRGGDVYVRPSIAPPAGRDSLLRDAVVYLTCLHESGHALGLPHTAAFDDIMYNFQYGGDLVEYFARYRRKLGKREDIRSHSGLSEPDRARLREIYGKSP